MNTTLKKIAGWFLIIGGIAIAIFSNKIVFPGLERLLGIETIVGKDAVAYQPDGSYYFTNPGAMMKWIVAVAVIGVLISLCGVWLLLKTRNRKRE